MSNEWKMVPVEPTAEMEDVGCQAYMDAEGMIGIMHKSSIGHAFQAMLAAAPVPPAGEGLDANELFALRICAKLGYSTTPEVLLRLLDMVKPALPAGDVEVIERARKIELLREAFEQRFKLDIWPVIDWLRNAGLDDRAHVTRLTAERDGLLGKIETTDKAYDIVVETSRQMFVEMQHLQSELTKERALLARIRSELSVLPRENWWVHIAIDDLLAPQSAPAAKDGESGETICLLCFDKKTVPGPKHGDFVRDCPECCGEEG